MRFIKNGGNDSGFTLLEVLMALTIFGIFVTAYITSESYNMSDSLMFKKENFLQTLCEKKMFQIHFDPPDFKESLTLSSDKGSFRESGLQDYNYEVTYKRFEIPDLTMFSKKKEAKGPEKKIFKILQKNIKKMVWQVEVRVWKKGSEFPCVLSSWLRNRKAKVKINI